MLNIIVGVALIMATTAIVLFVGAIVGDIIAAIK